MAKLRGRTTPEPLYSPDIAGLLRWLRQPPGQWSALGWQNAPAWADEIRDLVAERDAAASERDEAVADRDRAIAERDDVVDQLDEAVAERDEARREVCELRYTPSEDNNNIWYAGTRGWDCYDDRKEVGHG